MEKLLSLPTFFAAAKKVGAAPHRGNANRPTRNQGKANTARTTTKKAPPCPRASPRPFLHISSNDIHHILRASAIARLGFDPTLQPMQPSQQLGDSLIKLRWNP